MRATNIGMSDIALGTGARTSVVVRLPQNDPPFGLPKTFEDNHWIARIRTDTHGTIQH